MGGSQEKAKAMSLAGGEIKGDGVGEGKSAGESSSSSSSEVTSSSSSSQSDSELESNLRPFLDGHVSSAYAAQPTLEKDRSFWPRSVETLVQAFVQRNASV